MIFNAFLYMPQLTYSVHFIPEDFSSVLLYYAIKQEALMMDTLVFI